MKRISLDRAWQFYVGRPRSLWSPEAETQTVDLPHDFTIGTEVYPEAPSGRSSGFYNGNFGIYTKELEIPADWAGKHVLVEFDGSYGYTTVSYNNSVITEHPYGYTPFHADITPYLKPGTTGRLMVSVDNTAQPNSRWYSGSGLYRHVDLLVSEPLHIAPWGIFAHTLRVEDGTAYVVCEVTVQNETTLPADARVTVEMGGVRGKRAVHVPALGSAVCRLQLILPEARIWDIDDPQLYEIHAVLEDMQGAELDADSTEFGIRTITLDVKNGFRLNGRTVKLKGGCVHHDNGMLGAASFYDSEYRKFSLMKQGGFNAVRCAHNPPSREMLTVCDRVGLLVMDEAFDMWVMEKNPGDYHRHFSDWWERDMESFILRDRNHPSIVFWSTGNEVEERSGCSDGYEIGRRLAEKIRELDLTRFVSNAVCAIFTDVSPEDEAKIRAEYKVNLANGEPGKDIPYCDEIWGPYSEPFGAVLDVMGYNYLYKRYEKDGVTYPDRLIVGTESFPVEMDRVWNEVERLPYVIGDFTWTGFDYVGEAGIGQANYLDPTDGKDPRKAGGVHTNFGYPWRLANDSDFDICGFDRPQLHYRRIVWGSEETYIAARDPENHGKIEKLSQWGWPICEHHWNWNDGKPCETDVDVYSPGDEVELILNGRSLGRRPAGKANRYCAAFTLTYEPGTLTAISYRDGRELSRDEIVTTGKPAALRLCADREALTADGHALAFVVGEIVDEAGRRVPDAEFLCRGEVAGSGSMAAFGIARPITTENYTKGCFTSYQGRIMAILRAGWEKGSLELKIDAEGLDSAALTLEVR